MGSKALLSIAQFVDNSYKETPTSDTFYMVQDADLSMSFEGTRDRDTMMWEINLNSISHTQNEANSAMTALKEANSMNIDSTTQHTHITINARYGPI